MRSALAKVGILATALTLSSGCERAERLLKPPDRPDKDVTLSPQYNFSKFAGTAWQTKIKLGIGDLRGNRRYILSPWSFDEKDPKYVAPPSLHLISALPVGTRLRVRRLMEAHGNWSGVRVTAALDDDTYGKELYMDPFLFEKNYYLYNYERAYPKTWGVNPEMLERVSVGSKP